MTQANLLELAKQGDPQAIAALMNQSLQSKGMTATVERQGDELEVILEAERIPNRQALTAFVQQGIHNLGIQSIRSIRILGQQTGAGYPAWMQELIVDTSAAGTPFIIQPEIQPQAEPKAEVQPIDLEIQSSEGSMEAVAAAPASIEDLLMDPELPTEPSLSLEEQLMQLELAELPADESSEELAALWNQQSQTQPDDFLQELLAEPSATSDPGLSEEFAPLEPLQPPSSPDTEAELTDLLSDSPPEATTSDDELLDFLSELSDGTPTDTTFPEEPSQTESAFADDWFSEEAQDSPEPPFQELFIESSDGVIETPSLDPSAASTDFASEFSSDSPSGQPDAEFIDFFDAAETSAPLEPPDFLLDLESEAVAYESPDMSPASPATDEKFQDWFADSGDPTGLDSTGTTDTLDTFDAFDAFPTTETVPAVTLESNELTERQPSADLPDLTEPEEEGWLDFLDAPSDPMTLDTSPADSIPDAEAGEFWIDSPSFETNEIDETEEAELNSWFGETPAVEMAATGEALDSDQAPERLDFGSDTAEAPATTEWLTAPFVTTEPPEETPSEATSSLPSAEPFGSDSADEDWEQSDFQMVQLPEPTAEEPNLGRGSSRAAETEAEAQLYDQIDSLFAAEPETSEFEGFTEEPLFDQPSEMPEELAQNWLGETASPTDLSNLSFLDQPPTQPETPAVWMDAQEVTFESPEPPLESRFSAEAALTEETGDASWVEEQSPPAELLQEFSWDDPSEAAATPPESGEPAWTDSEFAAAPDDVSPFPTEPPPEFAAAFIEPTEPIAPTRIETFSDSYGEDEVIEMPPDFLLEMGEEPMVTSSSTVESFESFPAPARVESAEELPLPEPTTERIAEISADDFSWDMFDPEPEAPQVSQDFSEDGFSFDDFSFDEPASTDSVETIETLNVTATDPLDELFADEPIEVATDETADATVDDAADSSVEFGYGAAGIAAGMAAATSLNQPDQPPIGTTEDGDTVAFSEPADSSDIDLPELFVQDPEPDPFLETLDPAPQPEDFLAPSAESWDEPLFASELPATAEPVSTTESLTATTPDSDPAWVADDDAAVDVSQDSLEAGLGDFREGFVEQPLPAELMADEGTGALDWEQELAGALDEEPDAETSLTYVIEDPAPAVEYPAEESSQYPLVPVATEPPIPELAQMPSDMASAMTATESRGPSWLFGLVLLLLVGWLAGLLGFSLFWSRIAPPAPETPAPEPPVAPPGSPPTP